MELIDFSGFVAAVRGKKPLASVYIFAGPEALLRERGVALLRESDPEMAANTLRMASSETDWGGLADELFTLPFLAKRKLVVLVDDEGNFVHNHAEAFRQYLLAPSTAAVLAALVSKPKIPTLEGAFMVECRSLKPGELPRWLSAEAERLGKSLDRPAAQLLAARGGSDLAVLLGHLEKLASYVGEARAISAEDVRTLVHNDEEREIYELSLAAASKDAPRAFRVLRRLMDQGEPPTLLLWKLAWQYRKLAEAKKMLEGGRKRFEVTSQLQITYYPDEFLRMVDRHSLEELTDKHGEILKADVALKTSGGEASPIFDSLICRLAAPPAAIR